MRRFLPWISIGVAARLVVALGYLPAPLSDAGFYWDTANTIADGRGYLRDGKPTAYWPVGYSAYLGAALAVTGSHLWVAYLAQAVGSVAIIGATWLLARRWTNDAASAGLAAVFVAMMPVQWAYCGVLLSEPPLTALMLCAVWLLWSQQDEVPWARAVAGGLVAGVACLFKPQIGLLVPVVMLADLPSFSALPRRLARVAVAVAFMTAAILPWSARNHAVFGEIVPVSTNGGVNLFVGNNPDANGRYVETPGISAVTDGPGDEVDRDRASAHAAVAWMTAHPVAEAVLVPKKLFWFFVPDYGPARAIQKGLDPNVPRSTWLLLALSVGVDLAMMLLVPALAAWWWWAGRPRIVRAAPAAILTMLALHLIFFGGPRFHFPITPILAIGLAAAVRAGPRARSEIA